MRPPGICLILLTLTSHAFASGLLPRTNKEQFNQVTLKHFEYSEYKIPMDDGIRGFLYLGNLIDAPSVGMMMAIEKTKAGLTKTPVFAFSERGFLLFGIPAITANSMEEMEHNFLHSDWSISLQRLRTRFDPITDSSTREVYTQDISIKEAMNLLIGDGGSIVRVGTVRLKSVDWSSASGPLFQSIGNLLEKTFDCIKPLSLNLNIYRKGFATPRAFVIQRGEKGLEYYMSHSGVLVPTAESTWEQPVYEEIHDKFLLGEK